jgi:hypothetical protein
MEEISLTKYEKLLREIYFNENVKNGLQYMIELNGALGNPLDDVSMLIMCIKAFIESPSGC